MLKIKFWRIENVIVMKILEQGDEIVRGMRRTDTGAYEVFPRGGRAYKGTYP